MQQDTRLARLLHVLIHMQLRGGTTTSDTLASMLHTNPVVVRRTMAGLREAGYVSSVGGLGGGWTLTCNLADLTVKDIHDAIAHTSLFTIGPAADNPACPVESAVNLFVVECLCSAEATLLRHLANKRLSELMSDVMPPRQASRGRAKLIREETR